MRGRGRGHGATVTGASGGVGGGGVMRRSRSMGREGNGRTARGQRRDSGPAVRRQHGSGTATRW